jgi:3-oxoacyl-[acyl-carrier-protein] synthase II
VTSAHPHRRRVVVTGLGCVSPVGNTAESSWQALTAGRSGIANITRFDASGLSVHFAGEVKGFNIEEYVAAKEARHMDVFIHYGIAAGLQALDDCGLEINETNAERIGVMVGSGIGGLPMIEDTHADYTNRGARRISPFFVPGSIINMISGHISILRGLKGPNLAAVTACTTGLHSLGLAARLIQYGDADVMVAGGAESTISPLGVGGFAAARALSTRNDDPGAASRPWDLDRDGFVLGEGAGVLVLEEYEHARARGAAIYAELSGVGFSGDAFHMTAPNMDGPRRCMLAALRDARARGRQLHQCAWHLHAPGRQERDGGHQGCLRRPRQKAGGQFDQVHDRSPLGWGRRGGVCIYGAGAASSGQPTHH